MSISDKVLNASKIAKQVNDVDGFTFEFNAQGSNYFVSLGNKNLFLFENSSDCSVWVNSLNLAMAPTLNALRKFYDVKVQGIIA